MSAAHVYVVVEEKGYKLIHHVALGAVCDRPFLAHAYQYAVHRYTFHVPNVTHYLLMMLKWQCMTSRRPWTM